MIYFFGCESNSFCYVYAYIYMCKYPLQRQLDSCMSRLLSFRKDKDKLNLQQPQKSIYSLTCTDMFMPKPDEDHALPSKKAFIISGCPVNCKLYLLAYLHGLSCPFSSYLQYLECLSLCKAPQGYGLRFPPEQWGVVLLSVPCRRDICFWSTPVLSFVL